MADIFSVIADPTRRHLLELLLERYAAADAVESSPHAGESSVSELVHALDLSQPTVSKHLKVLRDAGLVAVREEGQHRYYKLDALPLEDVEDWVIPFLSADFDGSVKDDDAEWADTATGTGCRGRGLGVRPQRRAHGRDVEPPGAQRGRRPAGQREQAGVAAAKVGPRTRLPRIRCTP
jgi:ArsR family transcriptional regulator